MDLKAINNIYFLGIGGIGMSALARYFNAAGKHVSGYDKTATTLTDELTHEGIVIHFEDNIELIPAAVLAGSKNDTLIVYTPAVPKEHKELNYFTDNNYEIKKRSEVLGMITANTFTIAVAGTHGKTTTSSLIAHLLRSANIDCSAFLGGITQNYNTNLLIAETGNITVVEADEYDRSFLTLHPDIAVITSIDADHLDIYGDKEFMRQSYHLFANKVKQGGKLILKKNIEHALKPLQCEHVFTYAAQPDADYYVNNMIIDNGLFNYDVVSPSQTINQAILGIPGIHNVENSIAAIAVAHMMGIDNDRIKEGLHSFKGVKRRFEYHIKTSELVYIDDYAHHPEELKACIASVRAIYPDKKITGIFQPHLYSRTRDFLDEFARSLEALDELILMEIYPARELPIPGITSQLLLDKINLPSKLVCSKAALIEKISNSKFEVLLTLGAGDIDMFVKPITEVLEQKLIAK